MAYECPRCGGPVQRGSSRTVGLVGGALGALLFAAFGGFQCKHCGSIPRSEFPPETRQRMFLGSLGLIVGAVLLLVAAVALLVWIGTMGERR
jgi:hypothetical protein